MELPVALLLYWRHLEKLLLALSPTLHLCARLSPSPFLSLSPSPSLSPFRPSQPQSQQPYVGLALPPLRVACLASGVWLFALRPLSLEHSGASHDVLLHQTHNLVYYH